MAQPITPPPIITTSVAWLMACPFPPIPACNSHFRQQLITPHLHMSVSRSSQQSARRFKQIHYPCHLPRLQRELGQRERGAAIALQEAALPTKAQHSLEPAVGLVIAPFLPGDVS